MIGARALAFLVPLIATASAIPAAGQPPAAPSQAIRDARRELWTPGAVRALRAWLVRGASVALPGEAALAPEPATAGWSLHTAWTDELELSAPGDGAPRFLYAATRLTRDADGPAELAIASRVPLRIWVNGEAVGAATLDAFGRADVRLPVRLRRGDNRILLRADRPAGPARLSVRVAAPGQPLPAVLTPSLARRPDGRILLRTDVAERPGTVRVAVIAPGGRQIVEQEARRGGETMLDAREWADGPYDIRVSARDPYGVPETAWLAWQQGDPGPAARGLLARAAAATGEDAVSGHWRMLRDLLVDRAGADLSRLGDHPATVHAVLTEAAELAAGDPAMVRASGMVRLAWIDPVDGSTQFCRAHLPPDYDGRRAFPAIVYLHGFNPPNPPYVQFWRVDARHDEIADRYDLIWIEAHGRANTQYSGIGERDVLRCLEEAKRRLRIDEERVYLNGESMGGSGTWLIGARHPQLFAAIAPIFGGWDNRLLPGAGFDNPVPDRPMERWIAETQSSFAPAEQLIATPIFVQHGDADAAVSVEHSRHIVRLLQRWGYDIRYREYPGWAHEDLQYRDEVVTWLLRHRRPPAPRHVRIRSIDLAGASAWWLRVDDALEPLAMIEADAEMVAPGLLRLDTRNVAALTLTPPPALVGSAPLRVIWNGRAAYAEAAADGHYEIFDPQLPDRPLRKRAGLSGGLSSAFTTPFVIVVGTDSPDPEMRRRIREGAERLAAQWRAWQQVAPRMVDDTALIPDMERSLTLILLGGPDANSVSRRLMRRLPLGVARNGVTIDGRRFAADHALVEFLYPNPSAADRYVMIVAATSAAGFGLWNPASYWHPALGFGTNSYDWIIRYGVPPLVAPEMLTERGWLASGVFNQGWRRDDRWTFDSDGRPGGGRETGR
jgi:poly(3-hydroxybutyrate) depolymerase